jgi:hypothetical protein
MTGGPHQPMTGRPHQPMTGRPHQPMIADTDPDGACDLFGHSIALPSKTRQLPLPLAWHADHGADGDARFITGPSNADAVRHIENFAGWTAPATILIGPSCSGRSTLAALFAAASGGAVLDPLAGADEEALFHSWNRAQASGAPLLIVADSNEDLARVRLPDLRTRLATAPVVTFGVPDACLSRDLIDHLLVRRGLHPAPDLGAYVAARIERSYAAIHAAVAAIDAHALANGAQPGIRAARTALIGAGLYGAATTDSDSPEPA